LEYIKDSVRFLNNLIKDILDLNKLRSDKIDMEMVPVKLCNIVKASMETMKHMAIPKNIELVPLCESDDLPRVLGDYNALMRVSNNIISNAIKFTSTGGKVYINLVQEGDLIVFDVKDSGIGIPGAELSRLFDRFTKASRTGTAGEKGNGLGLSITKELVEWHNGSIDVKSEEGKGTEITIKIPVIDNKAA
jgi:signal transduction histidine kinase